MSEKLPPIEAVEQYFSNGQPVPQKHGVDWGIFVFFAIIVALIVVAAAAPKAIEDAPTPAEVDAAADPINFAPLTPEEVESLMAGVPPTPAQQARLRTMVINQLIADSLSFERRIKRLEDYIDCPAPTAPCPNPDLLQAPDLAPPLDSPFIIDENGEVQQNKDVY